MMKKRYSTPTPKANELILRRGISDGEVDMIFYKGDSIPFCDVLLVSNIFYSERQRTTFRNKQTVFDPSFLEELESRGYDLDTLRFSIKLKSPEDE